ncbi:MAG: hypothetical protein BWX92_01658 [Deltaproteobacteria bacterium ADurb.Bin135]|jgi:3'-phosphoadenosine 5'-phosphosulfate sulfotransferase (PAPS reductase)/FAD synthetase|nr:MAG: hypothetical protein BWX92_01658 [Deltaproteobacteria bacterium ADurb.Bin135]
MNINNCSNQHEHHILALSGGKDSAALAVYMKEKYPKLQMEYVFTDSGCELPETYEYLNRIRAVLSINIIRIKPKKNWENYWARTKVKNTNYGNITFLPSPKNRWCTEVLKLVPYDDWLSKNYPECIIHSYVGLRADEKRDRKGFVSPKTTIIQHFPFMEDGLIYQDIERLLISSGLGFPDYYKWRKRSGCYFCFYQTKKEWLGLYEHHPDLFFKAQKHETPNVGSGTGYTWCDDISLEELLERKEQILSEPGQENKGNPREPAKLSKVLASFRSTDFSIKRLREIPDET